MYTYIYVHMYIYTQTVAISAQVHDWLRLLSPRGSTLGSAGSSVDKGCPVQRQSAGATEH